MNLKKFTKQNKFLMLALDHRSSFKKIVNPENPEEANKEEIVSLKGQIINAVAGQASGILIDPVYGYEAQKVIVSDLPYLLCIEKTGYERGDTGAKTIIQYKAEQFKILGASGVKLLLPFHPDKESASYQIGIARRVLEDSKNNELPFFLEIILDPEKGNKEELIPQILQQFLDEGIRPDVFKLEFPDTEKGCKKITQILGDTPWILLTRGIGFDKFKNNLEVAIENGASGFLAGRALWQEIKDLEGNDRDKFIEETLPKRFKEISDICMK